MKLNIAISLLVVLLSLQMYTLAINIYSRNIITNVTTKEGLGVFWDKACNTKLTSINWGQVSVPLGQQYGTNAIVCYIKSYFPQNATLSMITDNWNPLEASIHLEGYWDAEGKQITQGKVLTVVIGLKTYSTAYGSGITNFSYDIIIIATYF